MFAIYICTDLLFEEMITSTTTSSTDSELFTLIDNNAARISIPREVFHGLEVAQQVRVASFLYRNLSGFLPQSLEDQKLVPYHTMGVGREVE